MADVGGCEECALEVHPFDLGIGRNRVECAAHGLDHGGVVSDISGDPPWCGRDLVADQSDERCCPEVTHRHVWARRASVNGRSPPPVSRESPSP